MIPPAVAMPSGKWFLISSPRARKPIEHDHPSVKLIRPHTPQQWQQYYQLRWQVLRAPWQQPEGSERDALEQKSEHVMVISDTGEPLGVGRVHFNDKEEAQIRYMAVAPQAQGQGVGRMLLTELETIARQHGARMVVMDARENAVGFYAYHGYQVSAEGHTLFGVIKHQQMRKPL
jgi:ribosomal protein S18 acetylase RimI-like enzyme